LKLLFALLSIASQDERPAQADPSVGLVRFEVVRSNEPIWQGAVTVGQMGDMNARGATMDCTKACSGNTRNASLSVLTPRHSQRDGDRDEYYYAFTWTRTLAPIAGQGGVPAIESGGWTLARTGYFHLRRGEAVTVALPDHITITFRRAE
jgi:hypothetical protein